MRSSALSRGPAYLANISMWLTPRYASTSAAPRPSLNVKSIRQKPDLYAQTCIERNYQKQASHPGQIVKLFNQGLALQRKARESRERRKTIESRLGSTDESPESKASLLAEAQKLKNILLEIEQDEKIVSEQIENLAIELPNLTHNRTPRGNAPKTIELFNIDLKNQFASEDTSLRDHVNLGAEFNLLDFASAAKTSGWGWYFLLNEAGLMGEALENYALKVARRHGFKYVSPPSMVYSDINAACGFRPRDQGGEQQIYSIQQLEDDIAGAIPSRCLAASAEIPFAAMKAEATLLPESLPMRIVGASRCFRREAGGRGRKSRGLFRVHEFTKTELFAWTTQEGDQEVFDTMISVQKEILQSLGLCYRILEMPSADLGATAYRKQDIEVYFPSRADLNDGWGEVTSTTLCTDYQTRRLNTRLKGAKGMTFPHTVNGTALAVPRVLAALLEYGYVKEEGIIKIPEVLWPWMHGKTKIEKEET